MKLQVLIHGHNKNVVFLINIGVITYSTGSQIHFRPYKNKANIVWQVTWLGKQYLVFTKIAEQNS